MYCFGVLAYLLQCQCLTQAPASVYWLGHGGQVASGVDEHMLAQIRIAWVLFRLFQLSVELSAFYFYEFRADDANSRAGDVLKSRTQG